MSKYTTRLEKVVAQETINERENEIAIPYDEKLKKP